MGATDEALLDAADALADAVDAMAFDEPVTHVYNPLRYARAGHAAYLEKYATGPKRVVLLGMNPGPWGMAQTGVPFGAVPMVRDWLQIHEPIDRPAGEHPKRPIAGFACGRNEVSGDRLWGLFRDRFGTPQAFSAEHLVVNHCPLVFMEATGRNRTPDKLPKAERVPLLNACDDHLERCLRVLKPEVVVGIGKYAEARAAAVVARLNGGAPQRPRVACIHHPSPANPRANAGWAELATAQLEAAGVW